MKRILAVLLAVLASGCGESRSAVAPGTGGISVRGRVADYRSGTPIAHASVEFRPEFNSAVTPGLSATTDAQGVFTVEPTHAAAFLVLVDGKYAGGARITGPTYRADLLVDNATCIARYGTLADARTLRVVSGATLTLGGRTVTSDSAGWYRIDLGCPEPLPFPGGTTVMNITHPDYAPRGVIVGRGIQGVAPGCEPVPA